jgi:Carboxypeptidase regulatory-like domain
MKSPLPHIALVMLAPLAAIGAGACAGSADSATQSSTGSGGNSGCLTSDCVPQLSGSKTWAIEIDPPSTSAAALTELLGVDWGAGPVMLTADAQTMVAANFQAATGGTVPSMANVALTFSPQIGGRPDLTFEASAVGTATGAASATLSVPLAAVGRTAALQLIPLSPSDQQSPPLSFPVSVAETLPPETLPASYQSMGGTLLSAFMTPLASTFVARAFQSGALVSNAPLTGSDGTFQLLLGTLAPTGSVTVELTPQDQGGPDPWYTSAPLAPGTNLGQIVLPTYSSPNAFKITVDAADNSNALVGGALVQAQAIVGSNPAGTTDFLGTGTTAADGTVNLSLLPGTATTPLLYQLTVIPPASSTYATQCLPPVGVIAGGTAAAPANLLTVGLSRRPMLSGTVTTASGTPVANVAITATAEPASSGSCPAVSASGKADANGNFNLPLDPGTYQLDFDPPAGSSAPRLTRLAVNVPAQVPYDVTLPAAALVQGTVYGPDQAPLPFATVRIFEILCTGQDDCFGPTRTPPSLLAQTVSDGNGNFQAVVNANAPSD